MINSKSTDDVITGIQTGARLALLSTIQEKLKEMERDTFPHNGNPDGHFNNWYNAALTEVSNYLKELE